MKILVIAATPFFADRGSHIRIYSEAKYSQEFDAQVKICTYHNGRDVQGLDISRIGDVKWYRKISSGFSWGKIWLDLKLFFLVREEIRKFNPDVIHAHLYEGLAIGYLAKLSLFLFSPFIKGNSASRRRGILRIPIVFDLQGDLSAEFRSYNKKNSFAHSFFVKISKIVINWADYIVLSSENTLGKVQSAYKYKDKVSVVRDGIDLELFNNVKEIGGKQIFSEIRKWKKDKKVLIYTGGMEDGKGAWKLVEEFAKISEGLKNWKLLLVGHGKDLEKYTKFVDENNLGEKIKLTGGSEYFDLPHYLALGDLAVDPKQGSTEASGKLVNYMAVGLPIVCFDNRFNRNILGDKGIYISKIEDLPDAVIKFSQSEMRKVKYDLERLDEKKETEKLLEIFRSLISKKFNTYEQKADLQNRAKKEYN